MVAAVSDVHVDVGKPVDDSAHAGAKHFDRANTALSMSESTLSDPSVRLAWKNLLVKSVKGREILKGVTGKIVGGFWAVMGPSGSGKTTLLNALACRMDRNTRMSGELRLNGQAYNSSLIKKVSGYVMQDDVLNVHMTVAETLYYTAELRLPYLMSREEKQRRIDDVMAQVGLSHVRDVFVGSPLKKGISGGERKRLCVAMELLTEPAILFLDEPTSGLDSVTALSVCSLLADIAATGNTTVVCTIHQPQAKIFRLFQSLILLKSGHIVYQGAASKAVDYFAGTGHPCPPYENPADHVMDVITPSINDSVIDLKRKEQLFVKAYQAPDVELELTELRPMVQFRDMVPWTKQFSVLLHRAFKEQWRKRTMVYFTIVQSVILALLLGATFYQIGDDIVSITKRQPALFFCVINQGIFGAITLITSFPSERLLTLRERAAGTYHVSAYFLSKQVVDTLCVQLPVPIIFSCICYWMIGFRASSSHFFIFTAFMILCNMAATSMALMVAALSRTVDMAVTVLPMALELTRLYGGFFVPPATMPVYFRWLFHMSYISYVYPAIVNNELWNLTLRCPTPLMPPPGRACPLQNRLCYTNGRTPVNNNEFNFLSVGQCAACLIAYCVITRVIAYCAIRWIKW